MTRPCRRITLQLSQMRLTLGLTFIVSSFLGWLTQRLSYVLLTGLLVAVYDTTTRQIVGRKLNDDAVLWKDLDVVLTHLP